MARCCFGDKDAELYWQKSNTLYVYKGSRMQISWYTCTKDIVLLYVYERQREGQREREE